MPSSLCKRFIAFSVGGTIALLLLMNPASEAQSTPSAPIPPQYFGMVAISPTAWPTVPFGTLRLWDSGTNWYQLCSSATSCDFTALDSWISTANANGITDIIYTFGHTPSWASSNPADINCSAPAGSCWPPSDLNRDGTGANRLWQDYVTAIATHVGSSIQYWDIWNEPYLAKFWRGTNAQLVRMARDARSIILSINPNAQILSPSGSPQWLSGFLAAGGGPATDIFNLHTYPGRNQPEFVLTMLKNEESAMKQYGQQGKPLWVDEGGWGHDQLVPNTSVQAGDVARFYLLEWTGGAQRFCWYQWGNSGAGTLVTANGLTPAGVAYGQVYDWLVGASMSKPCSANGNRTWTCGLTRSGGYQAQVVWNPNRPASYTAPSQFIQYRDLAGTVHSIGARGIVNIGSQPIILETGPPN